jgi:hypothetical protein
MDDQLNIPHDVYTRLVDAAQNEGTTPTGWIEQRLPSATERKCADKNAPAQIERLTNQQLEQMRKEGQTMLDLFGDLVGSVHSGGKERLSERVSELFGDYLEQKRKEGRL